MAIASKNNKKFSKDIASDTTFSKLADTLYGHKQHKLNKKMEVFSSDYMYIYMETDDDGFDREMGVNKQYHKYHDTDYNDEHKNIDHADYYDERRLWRQYGIG